MVYLEENSQIPGQSTPVWIDTDNALGSSYGDIDDSIALLTLIKSGYPIHGISTVHGNTKQETSYLQTQKLLRICGVALNLYSGADKAQQLNSPASTELSKVNKKIKILALGPLTNIAAAIKKNPSLTDYIEEIIFVGTNSKIQFPTWRFFDFNVYQDKKSASEVLESGIPVTLIPCDLARKIRFTYADIVQIKGPAEQFLRQESKRWFRRALYLKFQRSIPVWDLTAALYLLKPHDFSFKNVNFNKSALGDIKIKTASEPTHIRSLFDFNYETKKAALEILYK